MISDLLRLLQAARSWSVVLQNPVVRPEGLGSLAHGEHGEPGDVSRSWSPKTGRFPAVKRGTGRGVGKRQQFS